MNLQLTRRKERLFTIVAFELSFRRVDQQVCFQDGLREELGTAVLAGEFLVLSTIRFNVEPGGC